MPMSTPMLLAWPRRPVARALSLLLLLFALGCAEQATVAIHVQTDPAWGLDGLVVIPEPAERRPQPLAEHVELMVRDAWLDAPHTVTIEGTRAGVTVASGEVTFTAHAGESLQLLVRLAPSACGATGDATACTTPPPPACADPDRLLTYADAGTCEMNACSYPATEATCDNGCGDDHCRRWTLIAAGGPTARQEHTLVWTGREAIVWGGEDGATQFGDGGRYDPATEQWTPIPTGGPSPRSRHVAVWTGREMIVWGGLDATGYRNDGGRYDPATGRWTPIPAGPLAARELAAAVWTGQELIVWGGRDVAGRRADGGRYDPATGTWRLIAPGGLSARWGHAAVWTGTSMIVWGGYDGVETGDGAAYDVATQQWTPIPDAASARRSLHVAAWTGAEMIVWGGYHAGWLQDGARFDPATSQWRPIPDDGPTARAALGAGLDRHRHAGLGRRGPARGARRRRHPALTVRRAAAADLALSQLTHGGIDGSSGPLPSAAAPAMVRADDRDADPRSVLRHPAAELRRVLRRRRRGQGPRPVPARR